MKKYLDFNELKKLKDIYVIGHNNLDADSYFSSYILAKILQNFGVKAHFTIVDDYKFDEENKDIINDYSNIQPVIIKRNEIEGKNFILVDHNDIMQSLKTNNCNILFAIDHHIDTKQIQDCYSVEYTSTLLYIYDIYKEIHQFSDEDKFLIAISTIMDSEYLTSSRFKESDRKLYNELNVNLNPKEIMNKYFKTTDFNQDIDYNIDNNYKTYNIENRNINRIILKAYSKDRYNIGLYLEEISKKYMNNLLIWNEYDTLKTEVYYNGELANQYNYILTSSVLIIKDLIKNNVI